MSQLFIPEGYVPILNLYDTQRAIGTIKRLFADTLCASLDLHRVSAPLFLESSTGLNDDLSGVERKVSFGIRDTGSEAEVVQSLAKWKRQALKDYDFRVGKGLYTDMNAIRRDEELDNLHSIYVDQWDWEKVIRLEDRNVDYLKQVVNSIVTAVCATEMSMHALFPQLAKMPLHTSEVTFITSQELLDLYPDLSAKERENAFVKEHGTTFLMQIGGDLTNGEPHDNRAPDYDDWALNGDILFWNDTLQCSYELSSMGIRVSPESLDRQLTLAGCDERRELPFHKALLNGELPYTIGGGIGQSRLCMLLLGSAHIGEVQASVWDAETRKQCAKAGIPLL
ncbi:MAG: aspartate--ammonia ligase [Lachnospiraceae bacterium]|nr:aspartate--ammonia ligase [Lachnospiraceae bacterium]